MLGYDLPWFDPHYAIGCVVMAHISEDARRAILRENAVRLLQGRIKAFRTGFTGFQGLSRITELSRIIENLIILWIFLIL